MLQVFPHFPGQHLKHGWGFLPSPKLRSHRRIWEFPAPFSLSVGTWERAACQGLPLCTQVIIGHKPRQSSAFNYHGREVAQQSETIESGSPETARSGQLTVQLRDITRHLQQKQAQHRAPHATVPPPNPASTTGSALGARQSSWAAWGHPTELGGTLRPPGHSPKGRHASKPTPTAPSLLLCRANPTALHPTAPQAPP